MCPNCPRANAIDNLDRFEQVLDAYDITKASQKIERGHVDGLFLENVQFLCFNCFINNITYGVFQ